MTYASLSSDAMKIIHLHTTFEDLTYDVSCLCIALNHLVRSHLKLIDRSFTHYAPVLGTLPKYLVSLRRINLSSLLTDSPLPLSSSLISFTRNSKRYSFINDFCHISLDWIGP